MDFYPFYNIYPSFFFYNKTFLAFILLKLEFILFKDFIP